MDSSLQAIFNAAQTALKNDARQTLLSGAEARQQNFRKINNNANAKHMLFSGMPAARMMQYDQEKFIPGMASQVVRGLQAQAENQEAWDKFAQQIKEMNSTAAEIESAIPSGF